MNFKKTLIKFLYPHLAIIICLLPIAIALLTYSLIFLESTSIASILSYLLSFYLLLVVCLRIPKMVVFFKKFKTQNKFLQKWFSDVHLRVNVSLYGALLLNVSFAIFQLGLGFYHKSLWFYSVFIYYVILSIMRFFLLKHVRAYKANENLLIETKKYLLCGYLLLILNVALAVVITFIVSYNKTFYHGEITTIVLATYTFTTLAIAIVNMVKFKKHKSPVYSASKNVALIVACVSMLTLETTMLETFGQTTSPIFKQIILSLTGVVVIGIAIYISIYMILKGTRKLKNIKNT